MDFRLDIDTFKHSEKGASGFLASNSGSLSDSPPGVCPALSHRAPTHPCTLIRPLPPSQVLPFFARPVTHPSCSSTSESPA
jgi:hypothetical protein